MNGPFTVEKPTLPIFGEPTIIRLNAASTVLNWLEINKKMKVTNYCDAAISFLLLTFWISQSRNIRPMATPLLLISHRTHTHTRTRKYSGWKLRACSHLFYSTNWLWLLVYATDVAVSMQSAWLRVNRYIFINHLWIVFVYVYVQHVRMTNKHDDTQDTVKEKQKKVR